MTVYALQIGGWLPLAVTSCPLLLVDRNIVSIMKEIAKGSSRADLASNNWWLSFLNSSSHTINPVLCAMEGDTRTSPSFEEFRASFDDARAQLLTALPNAQIVMFGEEHYRAAYETVQDFAERYNGERDFLMEAAPRLFMRNAEPNLMQVEQELLQVASDLGLDKLSLVVIAALSCLYESRSGLEPLIGRNIIKPRRKFSAQQAHNAIADLRALELLVSANALNKPSTALCTRDKYLAAFWCGIQVATPKWQGVRMSFDITVDDQLFPRLDPQELAALWERLKN
jgi:hypothetical protein